MRLNNLLFLILVFSLLVLSGCGGECKTDPDCEPRIYYNAACVEKECVYTPIPGECGNGLCEESIGENKCSCAQDCGPCMGSAGTILELTCIGDFCLEGVPASKISPITSTQELSAGGDKLKVTTTYNKPFNMKKDLFNLKFSLASESKYNSDRKISKVVLEGQTSDRRTITLGEKTFDRNLWPGTDLNVDLIINFPTTAKEGSINSMVLKITYDYMYGTTSKTPKSTIVKNTYRNIVFSWVNPSTPYPCPASCDDGNPGTQDVCDESTSFFCEHRPMPGACGNSVCDGNEDRCTCPQDCGQCSGDAGAYLQYACVASKCTAQLKPGIAVEPKSLFDDRKIGAFHLQNNYNYNNPFNTASDKFSLDMNFYDKQDGVSNVKITSVRVFEGSNELAASTQQLMLPDVGTDGTIDITIPAQASPESDKSISIKVWYEYDKSGAVTKGSYSKSIGKITFLTPG